MENHKKTKVCEKLEFGSGSRLRVGKVLAPHNVRPKTVPLIKCAKVMWFFQNIYFFPKILIKLCTKNNKTIFLIFWTRRGSILAPTYLRVNGESGLHSSF